MSNTTSAAQVRSGYTAYVIIRKVLVYLLAAAIVAGGLMFAASNSPNKSLFGYRYYTILTPSMQPAYNVGDMIFVKVGDTDNIKEGDVITFNPSSDSGAYLTHRVTEKITNYEGSGVTCFRTKGDANDSNDSFLIDEDRVIGKVGFRIAKLGYIIRFIQLRWYFIVPVVLLLMIAFHLMKMYFSSDDGDGETTDEENGLTSIERK
jgi:signal peptidase